MKKLIEHIPLCAMLFLSSSSLMAQIDNPDKWGEFVNSGSNVSLKDTFVMQTFKDSPIDNWNFKYLNGSLNYFDTKDSGIENASGGRTLKLVPGDKIQFDDFDIDLSYYTGYPQILCTFAAQNVNMGEELMVSAVKTSEYKNRVFLEIPYDNYSIGFRKETTSNTKGSFFAFILPAKEITIEIAQSDNPSEGFYCIDSIYGSGKIQSHTLFTSTGNWNNKGNWSHLPALRNRNALIQGKAIVDESIKCNEIHLDGEIEIINGGELAANKMTIHKEFPEKGKWYFVSFPFDVYSNCVGSNLQQGDKTTMGSGNYFYVRKYNSESRAQNGISDNNWEVVSIKSDNELLFEKGKGYLVALDEGATYNNMYVSSTENKSLLLTSNNIISISANNAQNGKDENNGWILCGNPLTSALKLSDIKTNGNTDGNIYVYDGEKYQPYSIGSDYSIPAGEAFFMKANGNTEINIESSGNSALKMISSSPVSVFNGNEPVTSPVSIESVKTMEIRIEGDKIVLSPSNSNKVIDIYDISGKVIQSETLSGEQTSYYLPQHKGILIIKIEFDNKVEVLKHIRK